MSVILKLAAIAVLLLFSGFFSSSETAFFSLSKVRMRRHTAKKDSRFRYIFRLLQEPGTFLTTVLIGNELVNISISVVAAALVYSLLSETLDSTTIPLVSMVLTVPLLLLFGEIVPKTIALRHPESVARLNAALLYFFSRAITPLRVLLNAVARVFIHVFVQDPRRQPLETVNLDEDVFRSMVDLSSREGSIEPVERDLIHRALRLDDIPVAKIMTPRDGIVAVPLSCPHDLFLSIVEEEKYSRYPVYKDDLDHIVGFAHAKDLLRLNHADAPGAKPFSLGTLLRKPTSIAGTHNALMAFLELKKQKTHIGIVLDGAGKTVGIITMEDILEELFGEIKDEADVEDERDR